MSTSNKICHSSNNNSNNITSTNCQAGSHSQIDANNENKSIKDDSQQTTVSVNSDKSDVKSTATTTSINPTTSTATALIANDSDKIGNEINLFNTYWVNTSEVFDIKVF